MAITPCWCLHNCAQMEAVTRIARQCLLGDPLDIVVEVEIVQVCPALCIQGSEGAFAARCGEHICPVAGAVSPYRLLPTGPMRTWSPPPVARCARPRLPLPSSPQARTSWRIWRSGWWGSVLWDGTS